jgi:hypothetical protein
MSVDADVPMPDSLITNAEVMKAVRASRALRDEIAARLPGDIQEASYLHEIDEALDTWLGEDLLTLQHDDGVPLWSGDRDALHIREARVDEAARWHASRQKAIDEDELDAGDEDWLAFLVPLMIARD